MAGGLKTYDAVSLTVRTMLAYDSSPLVSRAIDLAASVHDGENRKQRRAGVNYYDPYIAHPLRNALRIRKWFGGHRYAEGMEILGATAILHDTVEDGAARVLDYYEMLASPDTERDCAAAAITHNFGEAVADAVSRLTNPDGPTSPEQYRQHLIARVIDDQTAYIAKASDLVDNAGSLKHMDPDDRRARLARKYSAPLLMMVESCRTVENAVVRGRIAKRLDQVLKEVRSMSASDEGQEPS